MHREWNRSCPGTPHISSIQLATPVDWNKLGVSSTTQVAMTDQNNRVDDSQPAHAPYDNTHKIPNISKYREEQKDRAKKAQESSDLEHDTSQVQDATNFQQPRNGIGNQDVDHGPDRAQDQSTAQASSGAAEGNASENESGGMQDTFEAEQGSTDPKERRKKMRSGKGHGAEREVTDPVTHLPCRISDYTKEALEEVPQNQEEYGTTSLTATGLKNRKKSATMLAQETDELNKAHGDMQMLFPPPALDLLKYELVRVQKLGLTFALAGAAAIVCFALGVDRLLMPALLDKLLSDVQRSGSLFSPIQMSGLALLTAAAIGTVIFVAQSWTTKRVDAICDDLTWEANRSEMHQAGITRETESVAWLNGVVGAVWPLVNPGLFMALSDQLEDVMQASVPSIIRMIAVEDVGQGNVPLQILGIKRLSTGAAARAVSEDGALESGEGQKNQQDTNQHEDDGTGAKQTDDDGFDEQVSPGLQAEEGDFVNLEVAFAYRSRKSSKSMREQTKNAHLYMTFYLPGNLKVPVWCSLKGLVGTMRMRLQLCPDPPFFSLCTLTFLGQPRVELSCKPLRFGMNIMNFPLMSDFVQSSVDAAVAEYVAPRSLNLDLKDMLAGDDSKKDTFAHGVLVVHISRGYDFTAADTGLIKKATSDPYISVGWAKFGKPVWSTRILTKEMAPQWEETTYLLVTPLELDVAERIRVQLWDSDRMSADDDLGRIEVELKNVMRGERSNGKMWERSDGFRALDTGDSMPGKVDWSVGYFTKLGLQPDQLESQSYDPDIRSIKQLEEKVDKICDSKLREADVKQGQHSRKGEEREQLREQERKEREDAMIASAPPPRDFPSGIFSIQIHNIIGLELTKSSKVSAEKDAEASDEEEQGDGLPSSYCTVIINHKKIFKSRTKPQNSKPFFNAGTEQFIADWTNAEVHISVRDSRVKEDDPLIGIVHLPLGEVFNNCSRLQGWYPLQGGLGYGRMRISLVWKSCALQASMEARGWQYGTIEIKPHVSAEELPEELKGLKLKCRTDLSKGKLYARGTGDGWTAKGDKSLKLGVRGRFLSCLSIAFESDGLLSNKIVAFSTLWLKDIPDDEERETTLSVWKGDFDRASTNCLQEPGKKVGSIRLTLTFWSGLGAAHGGWASKDPNVRNVVEVLDTARENYESMRNEKAAGVVDDSDTSDSDSDSEIDGNDQKERHPVGEEADDKSGKLRKEYGSLVGKAKKYKANKDSLHRNHRGVMQWRVSGPDIPLALAPLS